MVGNFRHRLARSICYENKVSTINVHVVAVAYVTKTSGFSSKHSVFFLVARPDASLALQSPSPVIFPPHSAQERAQGNRRTSAKPTYVNKVLSFSGDFSVVSFLMFFVTQNAWKLGPELRLLLIPLPGFQSEFAV